MNRLRKIGLTALACAALLAGCGRDDGALRMVTISKIMLLVEECAMTVADDNGKATGILAEASISVTADETHVVLRDTGRLRDITDGDAQVSSFRNFVVSGLMRSYDNRRYLTTIGCNRQLSPSAAGHS